MKDGLITRPSIFRLNSPGPKRTFDPCLAAYCEKESWVTCYQRKWFRLLRLPIGLSRSTFGLSLLQLIYICIPLTRAQIAFAPKDNDVAKAIDQMKRFFIFIKNRHHEDFDPAEAARVEVNGWGASKIFWAQR